MQAKPKAYSVKEVSGDKALPWIVVFNLRSYNNVKGRYPTEAKAKEACRKLNQSLLV